LTPEIEAAVLNQNWGQVREGLTADDAKVSDPVARLLVAHAGIATNRNNEATVLLLSLREPEASKTCLMWAEDFAKRHPASPVAHYLLGDARARAGQLKEATGSFDEALKVGPDFVLALSARGVTRMVSGDLEGALGDLTRATDLKPDFADAHANLGTVWVLQNAAKGAIAAFDRAVAIDSTFALAYNGRGCARFGKGEYDEAVQDLEKAFELCPSLLPAGANEAVVLAAVAAEATPETGSAQAGTTITTRSELASINLTERPDAQRLLQFEQSLGQLAGSDIGETFRVLAAQRANMNLNRRDIADELRRATSAVSSARGWEKTLTGIDTFLGLVRPPTKTDFAPAGGQGWTQLFKGVGMASGIAGGLAPPDSALNLWTGVASRTSTATTGLGAIQALTRVPLFLGAHRAESSRIANLARVTELTASLSWVNTVDGALQNLQNQTLVRALNTGFDFARADVFGIGAPRSGRTSPAPLREYRISASAPVTQFGIIPGATGKSIAPSGQKGFVLVEGGDLTDAHRLGTALRGYEALGSRTIPVPKGMDASRFMQTLGLSSANTAVMKITPDPFHSSSAYSLPRISTSVGPPPGGVTTEPQRLRIDRGDWPVLTSFLLAYGTTASAEGASANTR
jgi:tetratricopeptide (TPR) repeat protein